MAAILPRTRASSSRRLEFEEPKLVEASPTEPFNMTDEPRPSELDVSLLRTEYETQKGGPSTYVRRRLRQVLEKDVNSMKNNYGVTSTTVSDRIVKRPTEISSNGSLFLCSMKTLTSDVQVEACSNSGNVEALDEIANSSLSTERCLDVMPLNMSPSLHRVDTAIVYEGPYPSFPRPSPEECSEVCHRLSQLHGPLEEYAKHKVVKVSDGEVLQLEYSKGSPGRPLSTGPQSLGPRLRRTVLDSLVGTMLSQNTTDANSQRAFAALKARFPTWEAVYEADPKAVEEAIRCGGLAEIKSSRILSILKTLHQERGKLCLEYLRELSTDEIKLELSRFKGVGPKTIACVLMFHLQQNEFPVDTHVFRITKMLGWVPTKADREKAYLHLNHRIPNHLKFDLHCLLVTHGKKCPRCAKGGRTQRPADGPCPLVNLKQLIESTQGEAKHLKTTCHCDVFRFEDSKEIIWHHSSPKIKAYFLHSWSPIKVVAILTAEFNQKSQLHILFCVMKMPIVSTPILPHICLIGEY
ncbi:hypothetical protein GOP47_0000708 [Adiantum capillus-veneris]|uniref:HhH-GPD domain-containing protein n=1 Tax=Adiantum capillus-veneris TaxID=13818 RepID=A0A9D4VDT7_ADICA|nr:hypothetical protein GOP47_0000708 [Adiantum capillus-veneris]